MCFATCSYALDMQGITAMEGCLLFALANRADWKDGYPYPVAFPGLKQLQQDAKMSRKSITKFSRSLSQKGLVLLAQAKNQKGAAVENGYVFPLAKKEGMPDWRVVDADEILPPPGYAFWKVYACKRGLHQNA